MDFAPHFPESEMTHSDTAIAHGLENSCPAELRDTLAATSWKAEQARKILGDKPIKVTSGFRCRALEDLVTHTKGGTTGAHPLGRAVDIMPPAGMSLKDAFIRLQESNEFMEDVDQLIPEGGGNLHIGMAMPGRVARHEIRGDHTGPDGVRHYPLVGIWQPGRVIRA